MKIETKFNIGDSVFMLRGKCVVEKTISAIKIIVEESQYSVEKLRIIYTLEDCASHWILENELFSTKQDLLNSL